MMEIGRFSETSVDIYLTTRQYIPEDSELHTRRRDNLKSHKKNIMLRAKVQSGSSVILSWDSRGLDLRWLCSKRGRL